MSNPFTSDQLVESIKLRGFFPTSTGLNRNDWLRLATEETRGYIAALLKSVREEFLVSTLDLAVSTSATEVTIPTRAAGSALRTVSLLDTNSNPIPLVRVEPERLFRYGTTAGRPVGYMLRGSALVLVPTPDASYTLRVSYQTRPGTIVYPDAVGEITAINTGTRAITVSTAPTTFVTGTSFDLVRGVPGFETLAMDQVSTVAGSVITFPLVLPLSLAVGDFVCLAGQTPIPQVPVECMDLLAARVVVKLSEAKGEPALASQKSMLDEMKASTLTLLSPRVSGSARKIISYNGPGWKRRGF